MITAQLPHPRVAGRPRPPEGRSRLRQATLMASHASEALPDGFEPAATKIARSPQASPNVLLVEDDADDAELSLLVLKKSGVAPNAKWVRDGTEAMEWLKTGKQSLKLVLLDLNMPHMNGYEVLRRIKQDHAMDHIPVLVMVSAHGTPELARCFELGADAYLVKPLEAEALREAIRSLGLRFV